MIALRICRPQGVLWVQLDALISAYPVLAFPYIAERKVKNEEYKRTQYAFEKSHHQFLHTLFSVVSKSVSVHFAALQTLQLQWGLTTADNVSFLHSSGIKSCFWMTSLSIPIKALCNQRQMSLWLDADCDVIWRRLHDDLMQIARWSDANEKLTGTRLSFALSVPVLHAVFSQAAFPVSTIWLSAGLHTHNASLDYTFHVLMMHYELCIVLYLITR